MPKLQWTAPPSLAEVVGHVQVKAKSKAFAIEYLLYLARHMPAFPKKAYSGEKTENCTLAMDDKVYAADFDDYRQKQKPPLTTQKAFFADALTRGASMYDAGYRLTDPRKPKDAALLVSSDWLDFADRLGAVADALTKSGGSYETYRSARREAHSSEPAGLMLIRLFGLPDPNATAARRALEKRLESFAAATHAHEKEKLGREIMAALKNAHGGPLGIENWDELADLAATPERTTRTTGKS